MDRARIEERMRDVLLWQFAIAPENVKPESSFVADFNFDSLDDVEFVMAVEDEFALVIGDDDARKCFTFKDACDLVQRLELEFNK